MSENELHYAICVRLFSTCYWFLSSATMDSICIYRTVCNTTEIPHTCKASMSFLDGKFPAHI